MWKVLFIDDRDMDNMLNSLMVREDKLPYDAIYITSGEEALEFLHDQAGEDFPKIIFIDINMPVMNGFEFVEAYNKQLSHLPKASDTTLCFLTSSISESEKEKALALKNVAAFFNKPISRAMHISVERLRNTK